MDLLKFNENFDKFKNLSELSGNRFEIMDEDKYPCLTDDTNITKYDRHYVYHTAWAARTLSDLKPKCHVDISSSIYFATIVSAFVPIIFYDYRPADICLSGLVSKHADITKLPLQTGSIESLSCMHVVEHIGLGRYGDTIDPDGDIKAINELKRILAIGGSLLFVVPIGKPKIMFNAHRIYSYDQILNYFSDLNLQEFSLIPDEGELITNATKEDADNQCYGCGCFLFGK